jgi:hypothetical protein
VISKRSTLARVLIWWIFRALQSCPACSCLDPLPPPGAEQREGNRGKIPHAAWRPCINGGKREREGKKKFARAATGGERIRVPEKKQSKRGKVIFPRTYAQIQKTARACL